MIRSICWAALALLMVAGFALAGLLGDDRNYPLADLGGRGE